MSTLGPVRPDAHDPRSAVVTLQAGAVKVRHQQPAPFEIAYDGLRPVLLYTFGRVRGGVGQGVRRQAGSRAGSFALLTPGGRLDLKHPDALEVLAVACGADEPQDLSQSASRRARMGDPPLDVVDAGVRTLAHELRRVLRHELQPDVGYVEALGRAMLVRAFGRHVEGMA